MSLILYLFILIDCGLDLVSIMTVHSLQPGIVWLNGKL
jgi:hypothetical protein